MANSGQTVRPSTGSQNPAVMMPYVDQLIANYLAFIARSEAQHASPPEMKL